MLITKYVMNIFIATLKKSLMSAEQIIKYKIKE